MVNNRESVVGERYAAIVGAPRCGTTSLASYLRTHPQVDFSFPKEPHFFSQFDLSDVEDSELFETIEREYLTRYFPDADRADHLMMEGSVTYLYAAHQMEPVLRAWPDAKFIIAVRDPFAMLPSLHQRLLYIGDETETDFERAWDLASERAEGREIPPSCVAPAWLLYPEIGRLGTHVDRFFKAVGRERCLVVLFDDFMANPASTYRRMLAFLGLPDDGRTAFPRERGSLSFRSGWLQRLLKRPPAGVRSVMAGEKFRQRVKHIDNRKDEPFPIRMILRIRKRLLRWNEAPAPDRSLSPEMQVRIRDALSDDIELLGRLLGRDLSHWLGGCGCSGQGKDQGSDGLGAGAGRGLKKVSSASLG